MSNTTLEANHIAYIDLYDNIWQARFYHLRDGKVVWEERPCDAIPANFIDIKMDSADRPTGAFAKLNPFSVYSLQPVDSQERGRRALTVVRLKRPALDQKGDLSWRDEPGESLTINGHVDDIAQALLQHVKDIKVHVTSRAEDAMIAAHLGEMAQIGIAIQRLTKRYTALAALCAAYQQLPTGPITVTAPDRPCGQTAKNPPPDTTP